MIYTLISFVIALILTLIVSPIAEDFIIENTKADEFLAEKYTEYLEDALEKGETAVLGSSAVNKILSEDENIASEGVTRTADDFAEKTISIAIFVAVWIVISLILRLVLGLIKIIEHLPIIKSVNNLLGLLSGTVTGLFVIWLFFSVVTLFHTSEFGIECLNRISESSFLTTLFETNIFVK